MKSTMKKLTAVILVLVLTLSLFAGCSSSSVKTSDEYLLSEYGMTMTGSTVTYDGSAHSISVSATSSSGYSVSYSYLSGSTEVSSTGVTDAGTYEVIATITESDGEIYYLSEELTINPATLSVSVPDQYIRKGSDADDIDDVFEDLALLGSDTVKSIGLAWDLTDIDDLDAMDDVSEGKALGVTITSGNYTLSVSKGTLYVLSYSDYTAVTTLNLDVANLTSYNERFDELTYTENSAYISAAGRVLDVFENETDYTTIQVAMLGDVSQSLIETNLATAEKRKIQGYELDWDTSGDISTSTLSASNADVFGAVYAVAQYAAEKDEVIQTYIDEEKDGYTSGTSTALTINAQMWVEDDDGEESAEDRFYVSGGFLIDYDGRDDEDTYDDYEGEVKYGDYFYFVLKDYDNDSYDNKYVIEELAVRNKTTSFDDGTTVYKYELTSGSTTTYYYSTSAPNSSDMCTDTNYTSYKYSDETFKVYKLRADSSTIGALGEGTSIDVIVQDIPKYNIKFSTVDTSESNTVVSTLTLSGDTNGTIFSLANFNSANGTGSSAGASGTYKGIAQQAYFEANDDAGYMTVGEEVTLTIYMLDGYYISEITIGDYSIDGGDLDDGKYTFTVEEDMFDVNAGGVAEIVVYTGKSYDVSMKINSRTVRSTTGEYEGTTGTVEMDGNYLSGSTVYVIEGTTLDLTFLPDDNYSVSSVKMYFDAVEYSSGNSGDFDWDSLSSGSYVNGSYYGASIELVDEVSSNKLSIDLSDDCDYFDFDDIATATSITFEVTFAESWTFSVESDDVVFKQNAAGEFVSDYGTISVLDYDDDLITSILKGEYFMVYAELEPGYYISSMKINNSSAMTSVSLGTYKANEANPVSDYMDDTIDDGEMYFFSASANKNSSNPSFGDTTNDSTKVAESDLFEASYSNLDGGEAIVIEVTFDTYYELEIDDDTKYGNASLIFSSTQNKDIYVLSDGTYIIFSDDDSSDLTIDMEFGIDWWIYYYKQHTGDSGASYSGSTVSFVKTSDLNTDIYRLYYYLEVEGSELEDFYYKDSDFRQSSSFLSSSYVYTKQTKTVSLGFDDMMDLVSPGDEIVVTIWYDVEWDD